MGRISLAKKYYEETETDDEKGAWLVLYDFKGIKPSRGAITAVKLAKHYGAQVKLFKAEEVNLE
jgi:hypothetical protein